MLCNAVQHSTAQHNTIYSLIYIVINIDRNDSFEVKDFCSKKSVCTDNLTYSKQEKNWVGTLTGTRCLKKLSKHMMVMLLTKKKEINMLLKNGNKEQASSAFTTNDMYGY